MRTVGCYEAKTHLPRLLERVARGERITITKHGSPVAILVPAGATPGRALEDIIADIRRLRKGRSLQGITARQLVEEGRRF